MFAPFVTRVVDDGDDPDWAPLERIALLARRSSALPSFHEGEFMHMSCLESEDAAVRLQLYKHRDTHRYLNLDDAGHAYQYLGSLPSADARTARQLDRFSQFGLVAGRLAMEDAIALDASLARHPHEVGDALADYEARRRPILEKLAANSTPSGVSRKS